MIEKGSDQQIILASQSPSRKRLMEKFGVPFTTEASSFEDHFQEALEPRELVRALALGKADDIAARNPDAVVIGADTITVVDDEVMGKPEDKTDAVRMLSKMVNRSHLSMTAVAVVWKAQRHEDVAVLETVVHFRDATRDEIIGYVETGEPMGKAGAYAIQEHAMLFFDRIEGDPFSVSGLPLGTLARMLSKVGVRPFN